MGSLYELQTQLELALSFQYISTIDEVNNASIEIEKMLNALINSKKQKV